MLRIAAALSVTLPLYGCSSAYDIRAIATGGKVAFVPADTSIWGEPDCIYSISVSAIDGPSAIPAPGDDVGLVATGTYWNKHFQSCENAFPIVYGAELMGSPDVGLDGSERHSDVEAKPLRVGVAYEVTTLSEGSAYGGGKFMITRERRVVNLSEV